MAILLVCLPAACQTTSMFRGNLEHTGVYASGPVQQFSKIKWKFQTGGRVISSPAVANGMVYCGSTDGNLYALDLQSGAAIFSLKFRWPMFSSPAISGGMLYIGSHEGKLIAIDLKTQAPAWEFQTDASRKNAPAFSKPDGTVNYAAAFTEDFYDDMVAGVSKMQSMGTILASPVVVDRVIYVGSTDGYLYALI